MAESKLRTLSIDFAVTVDVVEKATGLNFFSALPQAVQKKLESKITVSEWKF